MSCLALKGCQEIEDAAMVDGAGVFMRLVRIMLPLLKPALATVGLFCTVGHWNDWFSGVIYMQSPADYPLQSYLQTMLRSIEEMMRTAGSGYSKLLSIFGSFPRPGK